MKWRLSKLSKRSTDAHLVDIVDILTGGKLIRKQLINKNYNKNAVGGENTTIEGQIRRILICIKKSTAKNLTGVCEYKIVVQLRLESKSIT